MLRDKLALVCGCALAVGSHAHGASLLGTPTPSLASWDAPTGVVSVSPPALLLSSGSRDTVGDTTVVGSAPLGTGVAGYVGASVDVGGHPTFDAGPATEGSAVRRTFTARPGDLLTLTFDFYTAEGSAAFSGLSDGQLAGIHDQVDDFAFVAITYAGHTDVTRLADVLTPGMTDILDEYGERIWSHTGPRTFILPLPYDPNGAYAVALGVVNGAGPASPVDQTFRGFINESQLHVFALDVAGPTPVPLPTSTRAACALLASYLAASLARRVRSARGATAT